VTTATLWIVIAIIAAILLIAIGVGLVLRRRRRISLRDAAELNRGTTDTAPPRRGGTYQTDRGFDFTSGAVVDSPPEPPAATPPTPTPPTPPPPAPTQRPAATTPLATPPAPTKPTPAPTQPPAASTPPAAPPASREPDRTAAAGPTAPSTPTPAERSERPATPPAEPSVAPTPPATPPAPTAPPVTAEPPAGGAGVDEPSPWAEPPAAESAPPVWSGPPAPVSAPESRNGAPPAAPPAAAPPAAAAEEIEPAEGRLERLRGRLVRSRTGFGQGLLGLLGAGELDEDSWEDVEAMLLQADLGPEMTMEITQELRTELARRAVRTPDQARKLLRDVLTEALRPELDRSVRALPHDGRPGVLLVVGVNGTGKTTTTGKLARVLVAGGRHVVLGAADTFRAAAAEQLTTWGERAGATVVRGPEGADPASVAFDAVKQGAEEGADVVLLDTAGRLHTKTGLMDELGKVKRVVERQAEVDEVLLVLDATTGQNGLTQARVFGDVVKVTGIVLTKLDGTAKGGIVFRVQRELGVPVKLVGLGEGVDDLAPFVPAAFVDALLD
jgi:fused signal recognition particle receptor